jgi:hypothetical protein
MLEECVSDHGHERMTMKTLPRPSLEVGEAELLVQEGASIIAEIAQREVKPATRDAIDKILNHGALASVASWADDVCA